MREGALDLERNVFGDEGLGRVSFLARWWGSVDRVSLFAVICLCLIGILLGMASSAGLAERHNLGDFYFVRKQAVFAGLSVAVMFATSMMGERFLRTACLLGMLVVFLLICLLPVFGTDFGKGAMRWYSLGGTSVQPSEFFKPLFAVGVGGLMAMVSRRGHFGGVHISIILIGLVVVVLAAQPDFGQAALIFAAWLLMYLVSGASMIGLGLIAGLAVLGGVASYHSSDHFARRIDAFRSAEIDPNAQVGYSVAAIENGGMFGAGIGEGSVKFTLPDAHTDFIIAVAAEEYGFVMVLIIILLYLTVVVRSLIRLMVEPRHDRRVIGAGLAGLLGLQAMINIGVSVRFFPAKGMTLPFVSYGGSSAIAVGITIGLLLSFTRIQRSRSE